MQAIIIWTFGELGLEFKYSRVYWFNQSRKYLFPLENANLKLLNCLGLWEIQ